MNVNSVRYAPYFGPTLESEVIINGSHRDYGCGMTYLQKYRSQKNVNQLILVEQSKNSISEGCKKSGRCARE